MNCILPIRNIIFSFLLGLIIIGPLCSASVQIQSYKKKYSWHDEWSSTIISELKKDEYLVDETSMLNLKIDEEDLTELMCPGYNSATLEEKSDFWVVFFSSLVRAESGFNEKARSSMSRGHRSYGLLQLAPKTAETQCGMSSPMSSVLNPKENLRCGLKLMSWQLRGAPTVSGKKLRPDLVGQIFGKHMFQWGPLRQNDLRGRKLLTTWFKKHIDQLKFCAKNII